MRMAAYNIVFDAEYERDLRWQIDSFAKMTGSLSIAPDREGYI